MKIFYLFIFLFLLFQSCATQKEIEYKRAIKSYEVSDIEKYIVKYPEDENIPQLKFRLRVIEYEKIKK